MGHGSYRASDWAKLKESRGIRESSAASAIFRNSGMQEKYNPKFIQVRESCDGPDSPEATPIIIGFDVTGSMGYLAEEIAKNAMNKTILNIYEKNPVTNPHLLCAAIGDTCDNAPLQVTQFEADVRILEQLMELWLEGRGGDVPEDYNLLWYFAARHTRVDAYEKRGKKGFLFTIGDAPIHDGLKSDGIRKVFGDESPDLKNNKLIGEASEKYELFHIVTKQQRVYQWWQKVLPGRVAFVSAPDVKFLSEIITSLIQMAGGMSREDVCRQWTDARNAVETATADIRFPASEKQGFFQKLFNR